MVKWVQVFFRVKKMIEKKIKLFAKSVAFDISFFIIFILCNCNATLLWQVVHFK